MLQSLQRAKDWTVETAGNLEHLIWPRVFLTNRVIVSPRNFVKPPIAIVDDMRDAWKQVAKFGHLSRQPLSHWLANESFNEAGSWLNQLMKRYKNMTERVYRQCILRHTRASIARVTVVSSVHNIADFMHPCDCAFVLLCSFHHEMVLV